ncbi:MAG: hypothetical protein ACKOD9_18290, partial [Rubrivivax sp.]
GVGPPASPAEAGHSFRDIVLALQARFDRPHWHVQPQDDYVHDQRLVGGEMRLAALSRRLVLPPSTHAS